MKKAQADIVSAIIIIVLALALVGTAYIWGFPLIQKRQDEALVERAFKSFDRNNINSITSKIESVARQGGEDTFAMDVDGLWVLHPEQTGEEANSIQFALRSRASNIAEDRGWIPLSSSNINPVGILGIDDASVVFGKSVRVSTDLRDVSYKAWFRELNDTSSNSGFKIVLEKHESGPLTSRQKTLRIQSGSRETTTGPYGETLIISKIKILFG